MNRKGSLLIIAAGLAAIIATMVLAFLARAQMTAEDSRQTAQLIQARLMLAAACQYVQETSRIGWDLSTHSTPTWAQRYPGLPADPANLKHEECFGWVDVRGGESHGGSHTPEEQREFSIGPRTLDWDGDGVFDARYSNDLVERSSSHIGSADRPAWPAINAVCRSPMEQWERPPHAVSFIATPNAIIGDASDPWFGYPFLRNPDPQPAPDTATEIVHPANQPREFVLDAGPFKRGRRFPDTDTGPAIIAPASRNLAWFRLYRDGPATFIVTVGTGATRGFMDWPEVEAYSAEAAFSNSEQIFNDLKAAEVRLWYRIEWSAAVSLQPPTGTSQKDEITLPGRSRGASNDNLARRSDVHLWSMPRNQGGTISFIQRLQYAPEFW